MKKHDPKIQYLQKLSKWRSMYEKNTSLQFLKYEFKNNIERPYKQLAIFTQLWQDFIPPKLAAHTQLNTFTRGILTIHVDSPAHKYLLDQLLRDGLKDELIKHARLNKPPLRKIKVIIAQLEPTPRKKPYKPYKSYKK